MIWVNSLATSANPRDLRPVVRVQVLNRLGERLPVSQENAGTVDNAGDEVSRHLVTQTNVCNERADPVSTFRRPAEGT
jgi:hypothetical protein